MTLSTSFHQVDSYPSAITASADLQPAGASCEAGGCMAGLTCVEFEQNNKRCVKIIRAGGSCKRNSETSICEKGYGCRGNFFSLVGVVYRCGSV